MKQLSIVAAVVMGCFLSASGWAQSTTRKTVDKLYVLDCGVGHSTAESRWTVGMNAGVPIDISVSCYLMKHGQDWFLWDTGVSDHIADMPDGWLPGNPPNPANGIHWHRAKKLETQLAAIDVKPSDIHLIGISHTHPDHIGNVELFPTAKILIQKIEYDWYFTPGKAGVAIPPGDTKPGFSKEHPVDFVQEDRDVFGDGSVMIFFTPGHTPGHESCLVHLGKTGFVILTGDAIHLRQNWEDRRIPYFQTMPEEQKLQTLLSMQRIADLMNTYHAQLWILHDKEQSDKLRHSPEFYD